MQEEEDSASQISLWGVNDQVKFSKPEEEEDKETRSCAMCMVGETMQKFTTEGKDHMEWETGLDKFVKAATRTRC